MIRALIMAACVAAAPAPALAERQIALSNRDNVALRTVSYQDLDLRTPQGAAALYSRLRYAAWVACQDPLVTDKTPAARRDQHACSADLLDAALKALAQPNLTHMHEYSVSQR